VTTSAVEITGGVEWTVEITEESGDVTTVSLGYAGPAGTKGDKGDTGNTGPAGVVQSIVAGTNVTVDSTDPANPVVSASGGGGVGTGTVDSVVAGSGVSVDSTDPGHQTELERQRARRRQRHEVEVEVRPLARYDQLIPA
jgi:hypothetical protein